MGEVYRATDTKLGRDVALKVLPLDVARDPERLARFQREARAIAALNHPHIITIFSVEETEGVHFLAAACGQLGETDAAAKAARELLKLRPDFAATVRKGMENWWKPDYVEHLIDGLRKAGLKIAGKDATRPPKPRTKAKS